MEEETNVKYPIHIGPVYTCLICKTNFINLFFMNKHALKCVSQSIMSCQKEKFHIIGKKENDKKKMNKFKCTICEKTFLYQRSLENHLSVHKDGENNKCQVCLNEYSTSASLQTQFKVKKVNKYQMCSRDNEMNKIISDTPPIKIQVQPSTWKSNIQNNNHQAGKEYITPRGKLVRDKSVRKSKDCYTSCKFKCSSKISENERTELYKCYNLLSSFEKRHFILNTTERSFISRPRRRFEGSSKSRTYSFSYSFNIKGDRIRVCQEFYMGTLAISSKPIYTAHKNFETNTPQLDKRGKNPASRRKPEGDVETAREHIKSFPIVESHYCKVSSTRHYLGSNLKFSKLYDLYLEKSKQDNFVPVKKSMYYKIFNSELNLGFQVPKSDSCNKCEKHK